MADIRRRDPFGDFSSAMDRLFEGGFSRPWRMLSQNLGQMPEIPIEVVDSNEDIQVKASLPGVKPEDIQVSVQKDSLHIRAESREETEDRQKNYYQRELQYGIAERTIVLPNPVEPDQAEATFENGVLRVRLPKGEMARPKQIRIQTSPWQPQQLEPGE